MIIHQYSLQQLHIAVLGEIASSLEDGTWELKQQQAAKLLKERTQNKMDEHLSQVKDIIGNAENLENPAKGGLPIDASLHPELLRDLRSRLEKENPGLFPTPMQQTSPSSSATSPPSPSFTITSSSASSPSSSSQTTPPPSQKQKQPQTPSEAFWNSIKAPKELSRTARARSLLESRKSGTFTTSNLSFHEVDDSKRT
jgi:hypothetical protein